jgi:plastocyanin
MKVSRLSLAFLAFLLWARIANAGTVSGKAEILGPKGLRDAVVYFAPIPGKKFPASTQPVALNQINMMFTPRVLPVLVGTTVAFPNGDEIVHNVFSLGPTGKFTVGSYGKGASKSRKFTTPGEYTILCNVHAEMSAHIFVTETPYFAVTDANGSFTIKNVPAGQYVVRVWHERYKGQPVAIDVKGTETVNVSFQLKR